MSDVYRSIHFGFVRKPLLEVYGEEFVVGRKKYSRLDVKEIRLAGGGGSPQVLAVVLSDGGRIMINSAALELNGKRYRNGFISGTNDAFEKLRNYFSRTDQAG